jgi:hypothetical protein
MTSARERHAPSATPPEEGSGAPDAKTTPVTSDGLSSPSWYRRMTDVVPPEVVVIATVAVLIVFRQPLNLDVAWYFVAARRWLDGARLYVDVLEVNPPLVIWLTSVPAWLLRRYERLGELGEFEAFERVR